MRVRDIQLPVSKETYKIRKTNLSGMLRRGLLPDSLVAVAMNMQTGEKKKDTQSSSKEIADFFDLLARFVCWVTVEPKVVMENSKGDEVEIDEIEEEDQLFIFNEAKRRRDQSGQSLEYFRQEPGCTDNGRPSPKVLAKAV